MQEEPSVDLDALARQVERHYRLREVRLRFIGAGNDARSMAYRIDAADRGPLFLKLRRGPLSEATLQVPSGLHGANVGHVIAPLSTARGRLSIPFANQRAAVYPYIEGSDAFARPLDAEQWRELGRTVASLHGLRLTGLPTVPVEAYSARWRRRAAGYLKVAAASDFEEAVAREVAALLRSHERVVRRLIHEAGRLAEELRYERLPAVLTHGDLHAGNVLVGEGGAFSIVDWDTLLRGPKERDLMFIGAGVGGAWKSREDEQKFYDGYGETVANRKALRYYRCERVAQDIVEYSAQLFSAAGESGERRRALSLMAAQFSPGGVAEIALDT